MSRNCNLHTMHPRIFSASVRSFESVSIVWVMRLRRLVCVCVRKTTNETEKRKKQPDVHFKVNS